MRNTEYKDLTLSRLGIGTVQFGFDYGIYNKQGQVSYQDIIGIFEHAIQKGVNFLDTSRGYGTSEENIGKALRELDGYRHFVVCTKLDMPEGYENKSDKEVIQDARDSLHMSMETLGVETIPVYLLHTYTYKTFRNGILWNYIMEEKTKGRIQHPGISIARGPGEALEALEDPTVEALQIPYNVFDYRWHRKHVLEKAVQRNVAVFNRSAYLQGLLLMTAEEVESSLPHALPYIQRLRSLASELEIDIKTLLLGYVFSEKTITTTILGVDSLQQFQENIDIFENSTIMEDINRRIKAMFQDVPENVVDPGLWNKPYAGNKP
jgi:aryl-alcohol dehydrogenase-like predicted oxidoreductase